MSKGAYITRYSLIYQKIKAKPFSTFAEIQKHVEKQLEHLKIFDENIKTGLSLRTFQRDIKELWQYQGVKIEYSPTERGYFISDSVTDNETFERKMEAFDMFNALNLTQSISPFVHLEKLMPQGTENLYGLLHAIKNKFQINFSYQKFWEEEKSKRIVEPYGLKEFKNRWYVLALDIKDGNHKTFALDRLSDLEITNRKFKNFGNCNIEEIFEYCFGIISPNEEKPQNIILSFESFQGKYIKTLPLHHTQQVLIDDEEELQIKLKLCITHDFIMELLSYG